MIVDASALVAILLREPGAEALADRLADAPTRGVGAATLVEAGIVLSARLGRDARPLLSRFLREADVEVVPLEEAHFGAALDAWLQFGKGRHPAALNFGDCLSAAVALVAGEPLLYVGDDFREVPLPS